MSKNRTIDCGDGPDCVKCGYVTTLREHNDLTKQLQQKQYYTQWYYCYNCHTNWFNKDNLRINTPYNSEKDITPMF